MTRPTLADGIPVYCAFDELVPTEALVGNPRNPNKHPERQIELLAKIIAAQGWRAPITVSTRSGFVVRGHGRLAAARLFGKSEVPVDRQDYADEASEWADMIADNRIAELAELDMPSLKDLLESIDDGSFDMDLTGFEEPDLEQLMLSLRQIEILEDDPPPLPEEPVTKRGDLWVLGQHRILCGDATVVADVTRVMDGLSAGLVFTDPPYGVCYVGKTKKALTIQNDSRGDEGTRNLVADALVAAQTSWVPGGAFYVCSPAGDMELPFRLALIDAGLSLRQQIVWAKDAFVLGRQDYHWRHETILYGWREGAAHYYGGGRTQDTVWEISRPKKSVEHPTMKPVQLAARAILNSSTPGTTVLDLFLGSGSTLIAAEQTGRSCYGLELDPSYCDVIVQRWEALTGKKAVKASD